MVGISVSDVFDTFYRWNDHKLTSYLNGDDYD